MATKTKPKNKTSKQRVADLETALQTEYFKFISKYNEPVTSNEILLAVTQFQRRLIISNIEMEKLSKSGSSLWGGL